MRSVSVCAALDRSELDRLEALAENAVFAGKTTMLMQGDPADAVYTITEGTARLYRLLPDGRCQIVRFLLPGDFIGLSLSEHYAFSADAVEPVAACRFGRSAFSGLVDRMPHLLRRLHEAATHELTLAQDHMVLLGRRTAEEKVAAFLLGLRKRLGHLGRSTVMLHLPMTRQDIADYLGLTLETVSRTFSKLAGDKVILVVRNGIQVLNPRRLEDLAAA
ncbi:Crp/Fnr family transcriptional regulator [Methylobacterium nodulans]|uniref:Crp/Fnr family transcriptional regulator n=1 Tax=Methylobacterium nodulans TaxID=114616 RepID=UPI0002FB4041|nr:helix-turn-helix domain-containing protein [Methylobacterium nodulans]